MEKIRALAQILQYVLLILFIAASVGFFSFANVYGVFLSSITTLIAWGAYKHKRWAYFSAAAWGLACYQLAKQGYEFQPIKHLVMALGVMTIPVALFLHEMLGEQRSKNVQTSATKEAHDENLPNKMSRDDTGK